MRQLIMTRGLPGAGKSTFIRAQGLTPFALSADESRMRLGGLALNGAGELVIPSELTEAAWSSVYRDAALRMSKGSLVVIDGVFAKRSDFDRFLRLADEYDYQAYCVDFSGVALAQCLASNAKRTQIPGQAHKLVPETVMRRLHEQMMSNEAPAGVRIIEPKSLASTLNPSFHDLSSYREVVIIGDLQGCFTPLNAVFGASEPNPSAFYVFVGDYLDRGIENGETMRWLIAHQAAPNMAFLRGNHEIHLQNWAQAREIKSREFSERTLPQLIDAGITREHVTSFLRRCADVFCFEFRGRRFFVNHAGLPAYPGDALFKVPSSQLYTGVGDYSEPVDALYMQHGSDIIQVHGHRDARIPGLADETLCERIATGGSASVSLEAGIEHGGYLRAQRIRPARDARREHGISTEILSLPNPVYRKHPQGRTSRRWKWALPGDWAQRIRQGAKGTRLSGATMQALVDSEADGTKLVSVRPCGARPGLYAVNLSRRAMSGRFDWRDLGKCLPMLPRALFVRKEPDGDWQVVARSYDKFFNIGEPGGNAANWAMIANEFRAPFVGYKKENGFLGVLGYDDERDELLFCSKSVISGDERGEFADRFRDMAHQKWAPRTLNILRMILRDNQMGLAFEVVDPVDDPHIIPYDAPHLILLDAFHRGGQDIRLPYKELAKLSQYLGMEVKQSAMRFESVEDAKGFVDSAERRNPLIKGMPFEGLVIGDADGRLFKYKTPYYHFVKACRSIQERVLKIRGTQMPLNRNLDRLEGLKAFHAWAQSRSDEALQRPVIELIVPFLREHPELTARYGAKRVVAQSAHQRTVAESRGAAPGHCGY